MSSIPAADEVRFPLDALWASASIDAVGIDYYAPLADWRDHGNQLDAALTDDPHRVDYLAGNLAAGEAYDWFYADAAARDAQTRTPITDGLGKPWLFRQKDIWNFWSQPHYERVGGVELAAPTAWVPQGKPLWLTEIGCPAVDKGANQPSVFPDPKSSESGLPYYSDGTRDDLDPAALSRGGARRARSGFRRSRAQSGVVGLWRPHDRARRHSSVDLGRAALSGVSGGERRVERRRQLADRALADGAARFGAARRAGRRHPCRQ